VNQTQQAYFGVVQKCKTLFIRKAQDYGTSWRILRLPSLTDQIYIKAQRIRSLEETGINKVGDSAQSEYAAIINYCVIALLLLELQAMSDSEKEMYLQTDNLEAHYDRMIHHTWSILEKKNHDYGEAWRDMRVSSLTDIILTKLLRLKQIEDNAGITIASEGPEGSYVDILNYAVFALIHLQWHQANE